MSVLSTMGWGERLPYGQIPDFQWVVECSSRQKPRACKREGESRRNKELGRGYEPASGCDKAADFVRCHRRPSPSSCPCLASARSASQPRRQSRSESTGSCDQNSKDGIIMLIFKNWTHVRDCDAGPRKKNVHRCRDMFTRAR